MNIEDAAAIVYPHRPRRTTVSELAMMLADRHPADPSTTVKTGTNAKGELVYREVQVSQRDPHEALRLCIELTRELREMFPAPLNGDGEPSDVAKTARKAAAIATAKAKGAEIPF